MLKKPLPLLKMLAITSLCLHKRVPLVFSQKWVEDLSRFMLTTSPVSSWSIFWLRLLKTYKKLKLKNAKRLLKRMLRNSPKTFFSLWPIIKLKNNLLKCDGITLECRGRLGLASWGETFHDNPGPSNSIWIMTWLRSPQKKKVCLKKRSLHQKTLNPTQIHSSVQMLSWRVPARTNSKWLVRKIDLNLGMLRANGRFKLTRKR